MGTVTVWRPPRPPAPALPAGEVVLEPPPELPESPGRGWSHLLTVLPMLAGTGAMAFMFVGSRSGDGPLPWITGSLLGVSSLGMLAASWGTQGSRPGRAESTAARRAYLRHLARQRRRVRHTIAEQRTALAYRQPEPQALWSTAASRRLWERRPGDPDFGVVRIGVGPQDLATPLCTPQTAPIEDLEPVAAQALHRFLTTYAVVDDLPVAVSLRSFSRVYLCGERPRVLGLVRALLAQLATFHAPGDLVIAVCADAGRQLDWAAVRWLPHALHPRRRDALGPLRLFATTVTALESMVDDVLAAGPGPAAAGPAFEGRQLVVILDGGATGDATRLATSGGGPGVTVLDLTDPPGRPEPGTIVFTVADRLAGTTTEGAVDVGRPDELTAAEFEALARQLAPRRLAADAPTAGGAASSERVPADLLGVADPDRFDPTDAWGPQPERERLRVPIGVDPAGQPVELDLKESAQGGMGPHGVLIGATGSGKSELLRTLVLALAVGHPPETLNFVLVDFKGGATFASLDRLPHTSAVITNLADELPLVDRMTDAINGELMRRQELLRRAGGYASRRDYERARAAGAPLAPLPSLLLVCDEFSELLAAKPDFIDMFVQIGRLGRSLGVHLLLASQRLDDGRLRGLDTHLSYRIGLRTFSAMESRIVLGSPDAYELPRAPGHGFLKYGTEPPTRFRAAYVSGPYERRRADAAQAGTRPVEILEYTAGYVPPRPSVAHRPAVEGAGTSLLDALVSRMAGRGTAAHAVWLPPLAGPPTLDQVVPVTTDPARGLTAASPDLRGALRVPVGIVDKPYEQRRDPLVLDLAGAGGHVAVVGGPQAGKSTVVRSLIAAAALTHTPREAQFYCLDFGGGTLASLRDLPHVGGVADVRDATALRRTVAEVDGVLRERERAFAEHGIDSMSAYRGLRRAGAFEDPFGDVFLVVDGWATVRGEHGELADLVTDIAGRGLSYGVHVVLSAARWLDFRPALRDLLGTKVELRLGDPADSHLSRRLAADVPDRTPGRGLTADGRHFLAALPRLDGRADAADLADGCARLVDAVRRAWSGPGAPPVRLLPATVPFAQLARAAAEPAGLAIPVGVAEDDLRPVSLDFAAEPHALLFGDAGAGKSTFLRALARSIVDRFTPEQARVILVDHRRSLLDAVAAPHLIGYGTTALTTGELAGSVAAYMARRLPGPDVRPGQLRDRGWWTGPECFVLVDDYDLVASAGTSPLAPLVEYLAHARDIGLHVVVARRTGGAARALYDPLLQRIRELGSPGIVMSCDRDEGVLVGNVRPGPLPPGRGWLVDRRGGTRLVQFADLPPTY